MEKLGLGFGSWFRIISWAKASVFALAEATWSLKFEYFLPYTPSVLTESWWWWWWWWWWWFHFFCRRITAGLRRFSLGLIYLTMYSVLQPKVKESYLVTDEYDVGIALKLFRKESIFSFSRKQVALFFYWRKVSERVFQLRRVALRTDISIQHFWKSHLKMWPASACYHQCVFYCTKCW